VYSHSPDTQSRKVEEEAWRIESPAGGVLRADGGLPGATNLTRLPATEQRAPCAPRPMSSRVPRVKGLRPQLQPLTAAFYGKLAGVCFATGAAMELFMIKTGFYETVTRLESERRTEHINNPPAWAEHVKIEMAKGAPPPPRT